MYTLANFLLLLSVSTFMLFLGFILGRKSMMQNKFLLYLLNVAKKEFERGYYAKPWRGRIIEYAKATFHPKFIDENGERK